MDMVSWFSDSQFDLSENDTELEAPNLVLYLNNNGSFELQEAVFQYPNGEIDHEWRNTVEFFDADADGKLDLFYHIFRTETLIYFRTQIEADGSVVFDFVQEWDIADLSDDDLVDLVFADFNADGYTDLMTNIGMFQNVGNNDDLEFEFISQDVLFPGVDYDDRILMGMLNRTVHGYRDRIHAADMNSDGFLDIVAEGTGYFVNNGDGSFIHTPYPDDFYDVIPVDLNVDGKQDLVVYSSDKFTYYYQVEEGFEKTNQVIDGYQGATRIYDFAIGDISGNGRPDAAFTARFSDTTHVAYLFNDDNNQLEEPVKIPHSQMNTLDFIDVNGDDKLDLFNIGLKSKILNGGNYYYHTGVDLFINQQAVANQTPSAPENLSVSLNPNFPNAVEVQFDVPGNADGNQAHSQFTIDYYLYDVDEGSYLKNALSQQNGTRLIADFGDYLSSDPIMLKNLVPGKSYRIGIQLVDYGYAGSAFTELDFTVEEANFYRFDEASTAGLANAQLSWADVNMDGKDEIILTGDNQLGVPTIKLFEVTEDGISEINQPGLSALGNSKLIWLDINHDEYPDLIMLGESEDGTFDSESWLNADGVFESVNNSGIFEELNHQSLFRLADVDRDGEAELVLMNSGHQMNVYDITYDEESGIVFNRITEHPLVEFADNVRDVAVADVNGDGGLDWIVISEDSDALFLEILSETDDSGEILTVDSEPLMLSPDQYHTIDLQNMMGDGGTEIIVQGKAANLDDKISLFQITEAAGEINLESVYQHVSSGSQTYIAQDFNSDGFRDILIMDDDEVGENSVKISMNKEGDSGERIFVEGVAGLELIRPLGQPLAISIDVNGDHRPDLITAGNDDEEQLYIYLSAYEASNTKPNIPQVQGFIALNSKLAELSWENRGDNESGDDQLRYQLWLSENPETPDKYSTNSEWNGEKPFAPDYASVFGESVILNLESGVTYYAAVLAVDAGERYSGYSDLFEITMPYAEFEPIVDVDFSVRSGNARMVDMNADGLLDIIYAGYQNFAGVEAGAYLARENINGEWELNPYEGNVIDGLGLANISIGDIDGDTKPDLVYSGITAGGLRQTKILQNVSSVPTLAFHQVQEITGVINGDAALFDADGDGDMDIVLTGNGNFGPVLELYSNSDVPPGVLRENPFERDVEAFPAGVGYDFSSLDVADVNKDGRLDILVSGNGYERGLTTDLYINQGGYFELDTLASEQLPENYHGEAIFADVNADSWMDIIIAGREGTKVALNQRADNGTNEFGILDLELPRMEWASVQSGDLDHDGFVDLVVTGQLYEGENRGEKQIFMFRNDDGEFGLAPESWTTAFYGTSSGSIDMADIDNDGAMDILIASKDGGEGASRLFRNQIYLADPDNIEPNESPEKPLQPTISLRNGERFLTWNAPEDDHDRSEHLKYNVRMSSDDGGDNKVRSGASHEAPFLRYQTIPNAGQNLFFSIPELNDNQTYSWSVQAIDASGKHSEWSEGAVLNDTVSQNAEVVALIENGPRESRINLVFLAEAWQEGERDDFISEAQEMAEAIFEIEPYRTYRSYFNSYAIFVPSVNGEISYGVENNGGDVIEEKDTYFNAFRNNYGNEFYITIPDADGNSLQREGTGKSGEYKDGFGKVDNLLTQHFPQFDLVMMLCKSNQLAGSAVLWQDRTIGFVGIPPFDAAGNRFKIARHELAHSLGLGDEYDGDFGVRDHFQADFPNAYQSMLDVNAPLADFRQEAPWSKWLNENSEVIRTHQSYNGEASLAPGVFAGAQYTNNSNWKRAHKKDIMRNFEVNEFGPVNREWIIKAIYGYRWHIDGMPESFHRIRPVTPIEEHTPNAVQYEIAAEDDTLKFNVRTMRPEHGLGMDLNWYVNDELVPVNQSFLNVTAEMLNDGINTVRAKAVDMTPFSNYYTPHPDYNNPADRRWVIPANDTLGYLRQEVEWEIELLPFVSTERHEIAGQFKLSQNYPNPFNPTTRITFQLPEASEIRVDVYDILGRKVQNLASGKFTAGEHTVEFNARNLANGVYFYTLSTQNQRITKKMTLLK